MRGVLTRPSVAEVRRYRAHVDAAMLDLLEQYGGAAGVVVLGLNHEQQHQELIVTDVKHMLSCNPLYPRYRDAPERASGTAPPARWIDGPDGVVEIGFGGDGFAFDNESPRHRVFLEPFQLGAHLVTCGEYREFMADGGYRKPEFWLSDGWNAVRDRGWAAPMYWELRDNAWWMMTLSGLRVVNDAEPVTHVSYYEADAYARWAGARLPTEAEWEAVAASAPVDGHFLEAGHFHPVVAHGDAEWRTGAALRRRLAVDPECVLAVSALSTRSRAHSVNTTPSSCPARWCFGARRAPRRGRMHGRRTETSFRRMRGGSFRGSDWRGMRS